MEYNDYELIMLYLEGNEDAQEILFKQYKEVIRIIISEYKSKLKDTDLEYKDLYSTAIEAFERAINTYDTTDGIAFKSYANIIIKRSLLNLVKKHTSNIKPIDLDNLSDIKDSNLLDPLNSLIDDEDKIESLDNFKSMLSRTEIKVFTLLTDGFTYDEISKLLNKSKKQITNTVARIRKKLKNISIST